MGKSEVFRGLEVATCQQCVIGWAAYLTLFRKIKEQGNKYRAQGWRGVWGLADWTYYMSAQQGTYVGLQKFSLLT